MQAHHKDDNEPTPMVTKTHNALNSLKRSQLGQDFISHDNLLMKLEKASAKSFIVDLKQATIFRFYFCRNNFFHNYIT